MSGLHVLHYPSGRYGFVGSVPQVLAHEGHPEDLETARIAGPGIARQIAKRNGRVFKTLAWDTEAEAIAFAKAKGFEVAS